MAKKSWIQDPETGKLVPKEEYYGAPSGVTVVGDIEPFISPVTGKEISSRSALREHNRRHGVTDSRDYSKEFLVKRSHERINRMQGNTPQDREERYRLIKHQLEHRR